MVAPLAIVISKVGGMELLFGGIETPTWMLI